MTDTRRQSGLWRQNDATGLYERESPSANPGPLQPYTPPNRANTSDRRSFAERTGAAYQPSLDEDPRNSSLATAAESAAVKMNTRAALMAHEKILASPEHADLVRQLQEHEAGGAAGSTHFARTGHFSDSLPAAMAIGMGATDSAHFRKTRHASEVDVEDIPEEMKPEADKSIAEAVGATGSESLSKTKHINETDLPGSSVQPRMSEDDVSPDDVDADDVPENIRTKPWTPAPEAKAEEKAAPPPAIVTDAPMRRASVPDRSPLQRLERETSKEEKRARVQEAENRAIQRQGTLRSEKGRVVSDGSGSRRPVESTSDKYYQRSPRNVSAGSWGAMPPTGGYQRLNESFSNGSGIPAIALNPRPYHHAPPIPRSLDSMRRKVHELGDGPAIAREPRPYRHAPTVPRSLDAIQRSEAPDHSRALPSQTGFNQPAIVKAARPYHHAPAAPRSLGVAEYPYVNGLQRSEDPSRASVDGRPAESDINRSASGKYQHRLRDAGFAGAAAAAAAVGTGAVAHELPATEQDKTATGSRKSEELGRSGSRKLQKKSRGGRNSIDSSSITNPKENSQLERTTAGNTSSARDRLAAHFGDEPDPLPREAVKTAHGDPVPYSVPPQTAAGQAAREQVGFDPIVEGISASQHHEQHHSRIGQMFHHSPEGRAYEPAKPLEEWKGVAPLFLALADLEFQEEARPATQDDSPWWEKSRDAQRASGSRQSGPAISQLDGPFEEEAKLFRPPMFLKCGPLLRYTGIRREEEREIWRGSIMIVSEDEQSDYSTPPTLRIFAQPSDLHQRPSHHLYESGQQLSPEDEDPVAGQVKVSRTGRPIYVRPVHDIAHGVDLSREENNQGLYSATRTPLLGPQMSASTDGRQSQHITFQNKSRIKARDGEKAGQYQEVRAVRLHTERGFTFWRWSIEIELGSQQHRVAYRINKGPALGFWVPARGETMNVMFHSCNGFSLSVDPNQFSGPDPLWRDVLNRHQSRPFHAMIGGGDQVYNDAAMRDTTLFREWLQTKNPEWKHGAHFSAEMQDELETFYLHRYSMWFSQGLFAMAGSQIPMVNVWDDHDIIDGYGSYPHHFMSTRVFTGLGAIAFKYYMLFQHQSVAAETANEEPSWILGAGPGPYINELSRHVFVDLGRKVKFLGVDCRTERMRDEILSEQSYEILFQRCRAEIKSGDTRHLIVLLGVPIAYPRLNFLENILTSRVMDPIKALGRTGMLGGFVNKFDGGVEILDDLDDHWTAKHHKAERNWFIQELQELAAEKSVRVTILGGDVHLGAVGQFYSPKKFGISKDRDHRYMPNVISSAIVNTPPPTMMADVLNRRNKVHHLDAETDEDLIPMFEVDVDGSRRNNKCLLPRRNYCTIREFHPGHTPPPTPPPERRPSMSNSADFSYQQPEPGEKDRRFPPGSMARRTMSLTRGPVNLVRRLSGSRNKNPPSSPDQQFGPGAPGITRSHSMEQPRPEPSIDNSPAVDQTRRPSFHRRPTNLTEKEIRKAAARGGAPDESGNYEDGREPGHINLEGGLDISLHMEIDQHDPLGATQGYRLLVPALWYSGAPDVNTMKFKGHRRGSFMDRIRGRGWRQRDEAEDESVDSGSPNDSGPQAQTDQPAFGPDGTQDDERNEDEDLAQQPSDNTAAAYGRGYSLSSPPIGAGHQVPTYGGPNADNPYPRVGTRGLNVPAAQRHSTSGTRPLDSELDMGSEEGSFTSDEYVDARDRQPKRLSKAERFFGINTDARVSMEEEYRGGAGGGGAGIGDGQASGTGKKRSNWRVWK